MSTLRIRATVKSTRTRSFGWSWVAAAETETGELKHIKYGYAQTWRDALAEARYAAETIDGLLMEEVHQSRSRRRVLDTVNYAHDLNAMEMTP